ncbi:MAG: 3'-5' exonuclease [Prochlorococcaceae cyanobacterium]
MSGPSPHQPSPWQPDLLALIPSPSPARASAAPADQQPDLPAAAPSAPAQAAPGPRRAPATLLILDTETTGLDPARGRCIEVGAILFAVAERAVLAQVSFLLPTDANPAEHVNGIAAAVTRLPQPWQAGLRFFVAMLEAAEAVLAHNAAFDRQWFGIDPLPPVRKPWICSMDDIRWPAHLCLKTSPSVRDLALAHGVPVWAAHRALSDCTYLAQVLERCTDLDTLLVAALEPRQLFRARLSYAERQKARDAGFRWNDPVPGAWTRRLTEAEAGALPFPVERVEPQAGGVTQTTAACGAAAA